MQYDLCVIGGLGHVGLPLSIMFANHGVRTLICDRNEQVTEMVCAGQMPFLEEGGEQALAAANASGNLDICCDARRINEARIVCVVIGTPVDDHLNPRLDIIMDFLEEIRPHMVDGQFLMLRSTVFPGTTELVRDFFARAGRDIHVAFCPERIAEGKAFKELPVLPQIISAFDDATTEEMERLFARLGCETIRLAPLEAELGKLFTNVWRYCQFAVSNQFYMIAENYGIDFYRIYDAIRQEYPRISGMAPAGFAAGPCLFKDTLQLAAFNNNLFGLGYAAMTTNEGLPNYVVDRMKHRWPDLKDKTVGILGMAFKGGSDDKRGSLSYKLRGILRWSAREVLCTDVHIQEADILPWETVVDRSDILVLGCPHPEYRSIDLKGRDVIDVWNFYGKGGLIAHEGSRDRIGGLHQRIPGAGTAPPPPHGGRD